MNERTIDKMATIGGTVGRFLVWIGMGCGALLFWYILWNLIF